MLGRKVQLLLVRPHLPRGIERISYFHYRGLSEFEWFFLSFAAKQEIEIIDDSEPKFIISNENYSWHSDFAVFLSPLALQLCH